MSFISYTYNLIHILILVIINSGNISHNEKLGVFTILGTTENPNVIELFPKESCSCPSVGRCYHIMTVRMSIGLDTACSKQFNSTLPQQCIQGRKRPRLDNCKVVAAPDSLYSNQSILISNPPTFNLLMSNPLISNPLMSNLLTSNFQFTNIRLTNVQFTNVQSTPLISNLI